MLTDCLPATGSDLVLPLILGGLAVLLGVAAVVVQGIRRRRSGGALALVLLFALGSSVAVTGVAASPAQAACETVPMAPSPAPTADPTAAPGTTGSGVTWYWKIHNLGDATAVVERFWDAGDYNNCVEESSPLLDTQTVGNDAGEIGGSSSFTTVNSGSCAFEASSLVYKVYLEGEDSSKDYIRVTAVSEIGRSDSRCVEEGETALDCNTAGDSFATIGNNDPSVWQDFTRVDADGVGVGDGPLPAGQHRVYYKINDVGDETVTVSRIWDGFNNCVYEKRPDLTDTITYPGDEAAAGDEYSASNFREFQSVDVESCIFESTELHFKVQLSGDDGYIEIQAHTRPWPATSACFTVGNTRLRCDTAGSEVGLDYPQRWHSITRVG